MFSNNIMAPVAPEPPKAEQLLNRCRERAEANEVEFTAEHAEVMRQIFVHERNTLVTGGAGVGKTWLVKNQIIAELESRGYHYGVTATTGIAGSHLSGRTIHSYLGIGLGPRWAPGMCPQDMAEEELDYHYKHFSGEIMQKAGKSLAGVRRRLQAITHLIVDEVSMLPGNALLGFIDHWLKKIRGNDEPFGGLVMIFVGDALQLPPVCVKGTRIDWAFMSWAWVNARVLPIELTKVFRQSDLEFMGLLNRMRMSEPLTDADKVFLRSRVLVKEEQILKTMLVSTNAEADKRNSIVLHTLPGPVIEAEAIYHIHPHHLGPYDDEQKVRKALNQNTSFRGTLQLKEGLPVLITVNAPVDSPVQYYNGSIGTVVSVSEHGVLVKLQTGPVVSIKRKRYTRNSMEDPDDMVRIDDKMLTQYPVVDQFPLLPASAITAHRLQGASLDECLVDLGRSFAPGQVYVALSRLRTPQGLWLASDGFAPQTDKHAVRFYQLIRAGFYK